MKQDALRSAAAILIWLTAALVPGHAQVHLEATNGSISIRHGGDGPWIATEPGQVLVPGDRVLTGPKGEADIELDPANIFHAGRSTEIQVDQVGDNVYRLTVIQGSLTCHVASASVADVEVGTPSVGVRTVTPGVYLISVTRAGQSEITAHAGNVEVLAPRGSEWVNTGQKMIARGPASDPVYKIVSAIPVWRRMAFLISSITQVASSIGSGGGGDNSQSAPASNGGSSSAPAKSTATSTPASPSSAGRAPAATPAPPNSNRGKL